MVTKLSRKQLKEALETVPVEQLFDKSVSRELTAKQKKFAHEVAKGATKADAYRRAYNVKSKHALQREPYQLTRDQRISNEIEAYQRAIEAAKYRTPAALRELVIQSLVEVVINPDAKESVRVAAAKVLGTVTEVAAFTERKEVRTVSSSEDAKQQVMQQIRELMKAQAADATVIEADANSLLNELTGPPSEEMGQAEPHPSPTPQATEQESHPLMHTIPHNQSNSTPNSAATPSTDSTENDGNVAKKM